MKNKNSHSNIIKTKLTKLEEQRKFMAMSVYQSSEGMAYADLDGNLIFINKAWYEMHGYKSDKNLLGKNLEIFHSNKQMTNDVIPFNDILMKSGNNVGEVGHITKDGKEFPTLMTATLLKDANGHPFAIAGIARDITERKQGQEILKQLIKDQATLLDASKSLTTSLELETVLQNISDRSTHLVGLDTGAIYLINGEDLFLGSATPKIPKDFPEVFRRSRLAEHPNIQKAISSGKPHIIPDLAVADLSIAEQKIRESRNMRTLIYVPLMINKKVLGVLILGTIKETRSFSKHEIDLYITLSHQAALSIQNAHLFNETKQYVTELEQRIKERKQAEEKLINRNKELELYNEITVGRELKIIELKKEINELLEKSDEKPKYKIPI